MHAMLIQITRLEFHTFRLKYSSAAVCGWGRNLDHLHKFPRVHNDTVLLNQIDVYFNVVPVIPF